MDTVHHTIMKNYQDFIARCVKSNEMLLSPPEVKVGCTPHRTVFWKYNVQLVKYPAKNEKRFQTPILITYALVNRPYVMDLIPGRSIIEVLVSRGFDVYLIDWGNPVSSDADRGMDFYINTYIDTMVDKVRELSGEDRINLLGYCMGGTLALIYTALNQQKIRNLILMAAPFDNSGNDGILALWSKEVPVDEITAAYGNCPGWFLANSFAMLNPMNTVDKAVSFYRGMVDAPFVDLFLAMEKWINDTVDVPGKMYTDFLKAVFQQNLLPKGELVLAGVPVNLKNIVCPFLNLVADLDTSVPPSSSRAIGDHLGSTDKELMTCPAGHIGLAVSGRAQKKFWPAVAEWIGARSAEAIQESE